MTAQFGAHETMHVHEVLTRAIDTINLFQLYRPHVQDPQLRNLLDKQTEFMTREYDSMVQTLNQHNLSQAIPYRAARNVSPTYGLRNPSTQSPNPSPIEMDDRDVASGILGCHKSSAVFKMTASLECANPELRRLVQQGAINCAEQAYEVWHYMNQKGYYQVPTMKETTTATTMSAFAPVGASMGQEQPQYGSQQIGHYQQAGHYQSVHHETGHYQPGQQQTGHYQSGQYHTGQYQTGQQQTGHYYSGQHQIGSSQFGNFEATPSRTGQIHPEHQLQSNVHQTGHKATQEGQPWGYQGTVREEQAKRHQ